MAIFQTALHNDYFYSGFLEYFKVAKFTSNFNSWFIKDGARLTQYIKAKANQ